MTPKLLVQPFARTPPSFVHKRGRSGRDAAVCEMSSGRAPPNFAVAFELGVQ